MRIQTIASIAGAAATAVLALPSLYLARRLRYEGFEPSRDQLPKSLDLQVTAISAETVTLRRAAKSPSVAPDEPGRFLLDAARGWGHVGRVIDSNEIIAIREFRPGAGDIRSGDYGRLDTYAFPSDPAAAHGLTFHDVTFTSAQGDFAAWHVPGNSKTWAILTHGKGADRREALRIMPALAGSGFHCLAITYRNDAGLPQGADRHYSYGRDEWLELEASAEYALGHGATDIVLVGYSMGGAITLSFMAKSERAEAVSALILDAPMSHLEETVKHGAKLAGLPVWFLRVSNRLSARLYRFRWSDFDYLKTLPGLSVPVLLFHGEIDRTIPVSLSDTFAAMRPDLVTYHRVTDADHVRAWNVAPETYEHTVREFVRTRRSVRSRQ